MDLRTVRKALGMSSAEIAWLFGVKPNTVQCWESGKRRHGNPAAVRALVFLLAGYGRRHAHLALAGLTRDGKPMPELIPKRLERVHGHVYKAVA